MAFRRRFCTETRDAEEMYSALVPPCQLFKSIVWQTRYGAN